MSGKRLLKRILAVTAGAIAFILFVAVVQSDATPIRPNLKQVLSQSADDHTYFPLARAGWNGPEQTAARDTRNPTLERLGPAASARAARSSLISAAMPDYRAVAAIMLIILLLRRIRMHEEKQRRLAKLLPFPAPADAPAHNVTVEGVTEHTA